MSDRLSKASGFSMLPLPSLFHLQYPMALHTCPPLLGFFFSFPPFFFFFCLLITHPFLLTHSFIFILVEMDFSTKFFLVLRNGPSLPLCLLNLCFHRVFVSVGDSPGFTLAVCILLLLTQREVYFTRGYCLVYSNFAVSLLNLFRRRERTESIHTYIHTYIYIYMRRNKRLSLQSSII